MFANPDDKALFDHLVAEYNHPFVWSDWSYLDGRRTADLSETFENYHDAVIAAMKDAHAMLDMRTGDGARLAALADQHPLPPRTYATEGYAPNLALARQQLAPIGVSVYPVDDDQLPFEDEQFDLVINRHSSYDLREVARVLKPGGRFITLQVGSETNREIHTWLERQHDSAASDPDSTRKPAWNLAHASAKFQDGNWQILTQLEMFAPVQYYDIGALVFYLKAIPWEISDFSVESYFPRLVELHHRIQQEGSLSVTFHSFFIVAQKL